MSKQTLIKKLKIKENYSLTIINKPKNYLEQLGELPCGVTINEKFTGQNVFVQIFVNSKNELQTLVPKGIKILKPEGEIWVCYPKKSSKVNSDISRDEGWKILESFGLKGTDFISIDETWTAFGLYKNEFFKDKPKKIIEPPKESYLIDKTNRTVKLPEDAKAILKNNKKLLQYFETLSFSHKKEYVEWIISAKKVETRNLRLHKFVEMLNNNKKNPSDK